MPPASVPQELARFLEAHHLRAAEALAGQRRFAAEAAHELRTPVAAVSFQFEHLLAATTYAERLQRQAALRRGLAGLHALYEQLVVLGDESPHIDQRVPLIDVARVVAGNVVEMEMERGDAEVTDILWNLGDAADVPVPAAGTLQLDGHLAEYRTKDIAMPSLVAERPGEGVTPSVLCPPVSPEPRRLQPLPARPW